MRFDFGEPTRHSHGIKAEDAERLTMGRKSHNPGNINKPADAEKTILEHSENIEDTVTSSPAPQSTIEPVGTIDPDDSHRRPSQGTATLRRDRRAKGAVRAAHARPAENQQFTGGPASDTASNAVPNSSAASSASAALSPTTPRQWLIFVALTVVFSLIAYIAYGFIIYGKVLLPWQDNTPTVTVGVGVAPKNLNLAASSSDPTSQALLGNVYQPLLQREQTKNIPAQTSPLLKSWSISSNGLEYTFTLKDNVYFSNERKMDANDVVWSLRNGIRKKYPGYDELKDAQSISVSGDNTVKITLSSPKPHLAWLLTGRVGAVYSRAEGGAKDSSAVGTGPYTVKSFEQGRKLQLKARIDHQYRAANTNDVNFAYYSDADVALKDIRSGKIDVYIPPQPVAASAVSQAQKDSSLVADTSDTSTRVALAFNGSADSKFSEQRAREAYRDIVSKPTLINGLGYSASPITGPISTVDPGYEDLSIKYPQDISGARQKLWYFNFTSSTLVYPRSMGPKIGELLKVQFAAAGQKITVKMLDDAEYHTQVEVKKKFDMTLVRYTSGQDLGTIVDPNYFIGFTDAQTDADWAAAQSSRTLSQYYANLTKTAERITDKAALAWLYQENAAVIRRNTISAVKTTSPASYLPLSAGLQKKK